MIRSLLSWLICGYGQRSKAVCFCYGLGRGWRLALDTRRGRFWSWLINFERAIKDSPHRFRHWRADRLSAKAMRLRGQKPTVFGFYDCARGNEAAKLARQIWESAVDICDFENEDHREKLIGIEEQIERLSHMAGGAWVRNNEPEASK